MIFKNIVIVGPFRISKRILSIFQNKTESQIFIWKSLISLRNKTLLGTKISHGPSIIISIITYCCSYINYRTKGKNVFDTANISKYHITSVFLSQIKIYTPLFISIVSVVFILANWKKVFFSFQRPVYV